MKSASMAGSFTATSAGASGKQVSQPRTAGKGTAGCNLRMPWRRRRETLGTNGHVPGLQGRVVIDGLEIQECVSAELRRVRFRTKAAVMTPQGKGSQHCPAPSEQALER